MICPNKICKQEIPDDSCFCDQCGVQLLRCDKCGFVSTAKFCGACGGSMSSIESPAAQQAGQPPSATESAPSVTPVAQPSAAVASAPVSEPSVVPAATAPAATVIVTLPTENIFFCHPENWNMEISNGDIIGRTNGPHAAKLGRFPVISSNHAKVTRENNEWFITDLKSTNKTYVNGKKLEPDVPEKIKQNDVVILANVTFTVREA